MRGAPTRQPARRAQMISAGSAGLGQPSPSRRKQSSLSSSLSRETPTRPPGLLRALRRLLEHIGSDADRCAVFWDFCALPQKDGALFDANETPEAQPEAERPAFIADLIAKRRFYGGEAYEKSRSSADNVTFKKGLKMMGKFYGSMWRTTVVQHKLVPHVQCSNYNGRAYPMRGWCVFEEGVASLAAGHCSAGPALGWGPWAGGKQPKLLEISGFSAKEGVQAEQPNVHVIKVRKAPELEELEGGSLTSSRRAYRRTYGSSCARCGTIDATFAARLSTLALSAAGKTARRQLLYSSRKK